MSFARIVVPEVLDGLAANDPDAQRSRRDLQRVHQIMGTRRTVLRALRALPMQRMDKRPLQVLELGAGDGSLMLGVARGLTGEWPRVALTLLDLQNLLSATTTADYAAVGWEVKVQVGDALAWAERSDADTDTATKLDTTPPGAPRWDLIVANLFMHHFKDPQLAVLLAAVAARSAHFFACEPRRAGLALVGSHLIGALGVNSVTREDAVLSVRAGFRDGELSALWPTMRSKKATALTPEPTSEWTLKEYSAGLFSHCLLASRADAARPNPQPDSR